MGRKTKGWDGTPPVHTYPYAVRSMGHLWGEPGIAIWTGPNAPTEGRFISSTWDREDAHIVIKELITSGDYAPMLGTGTPSEYREIHRIALPAELLKGPRDVAYRWVHDQLDAYARTEHGVTIFKP